MATSSWNLRGASTNEYIVNPILRKKLYYASEYATLFGKLNGMRDVTVTEIERGNSKIKVTGGSGEMSPVWEQDFGQSTGEARFTRVAPMSGLETYGRAEVKIGAFDSFKHEVVHAVQHDSPVQPLIDKESQFRQSEVISVGDVVASKKAQMELWRQKVLEINAFRSMFDGYSRGLLSAADGGMGLALPGATAGQNRSPYNTVVANEFALTTPNFTRTTHEGTLSTLVNALSDQAVHGFDWEQHKFMSYIIGNRKLKPCSVGSGQYRAIAIADPAAMQSLGAYGGSLETMLRAANERAMQNPILKGMSAWELDDILYIASNYMEYFRPTADGTTTDYLGIDNDPFASSFSNTSKNVMIMYLGAGALCRGRRKDVHFTVSGEGASDAGHQKGTSYCLHYYDGWKRTEWVTKDGTSALENDASVLWIGYDPGIGKAFAA